MTDLLGSLLPAGVEINTNPNVKGTSVNENSGSVRADWTFLSIDTAFGGFIMEVSTTFPSEVIVQIPIPGRASGPIQQKMNTVTPRTVTVNLVSENNTSKPDNATIITAMDDAGEIEADWFLQTDQENFDVNTKNYRRTRTHVVKQ